MKNENKKTNKHCVNKNTDKQDVQYCAPYKALKMVNFNLSFCKEIGNILI